MKLLITIIFLVGLQTDPSGLKVGDKAPNFIGTDQDGNRIELNEVLKEHKAVVTFYRGAWCRYCMAQFRDYQDSLSYFTDNNVRLIAISPEHEEGIRKSAEVSKAEFSFLHDDGLQIMQDYEVISAEKVTEYKNGLEQSGKDNQEKYLPVPTTYVINQDGIIEYVYFDPNYRVRVPVSTLIQYFD